MFNICQNLEGEISSTHSQKLCWAVWLTQPFCISRSLYNIMPKEIMTLFYNILENKLSKVAVIFCNIFCPQYLCWCISLCYSKSLKLTISKFQWYPGSSWYPQHILGPSHHSLMLFILLMSLKTMRTRKPSALVVSTIY